MQCDYRIASTAMFTAITPRLCLAFAGTALVSVNSGVSQSVSRPAHSTFTQALVFHGSMSKAMLRFTAALPLTRQSNVIGSHERDSTVPPWVPIHRAQYPRRGRARHSGRSIRPGVRLQITTTKVRTNALVLFPNYEQAIEFGHNVGF